MVSGRLGSSMVTGLPWIKKRAQTELVRQIKYMIANAYYLYVTELVKKTAEVLGKAEEAEKYGDLYETTLDAFQREYYTETGRIVSETQTGAILSLYFNLAREK